MGARWLWKLGGGQINKTRGAQSKSGEAPMVKIKDFTLASQNLGGGGIWPPVPYTPGAHACHSREESACVGDTAYIRLHIHIPVCCVLQISFYERLQDLLKTLFKTSCTFFASNIPIRERPQWWLRFLLSWCFLFCWESAVDAPNEIDALIKVWRLAGRSHFDLHCLFCKFVLFKNLWNKRRKREPTLFNWYAALSSRRAQLIDRHTNQNKLK